MSRTGSNPESILLNQQRTLQAQRCRIAFKRPGTGATIQRRLRPQSGNPMDQLEQLKAKYKSVLEFIKQSGVHLTHVHVQDNKLLIQGAAPSEQIKNEVWNRIKATDSAYGDLTCDLSVDSSLPQPQAAQATAASANATTGGRTYKVQPGDTLSKIAKEFYGNSNDYTRIFAANRDKLESPDKIQAGQELVIPG